MPNLKLNDTNVSKVALPPKGSKPVFYWDSGEGSLKGFGLKVSSQDKTYIVQKRLAGGREAKFVRYQIGSVAAWKAEEARKAARDKVRDLEQGINVNKVERQKLKDEEVQGLTLVQAYEEFKASRELRPRTVQTYDENINRTLKDWLGLPLTAITSEMILKKHKQISTAGRGGRGVGSANQAMRLVRVIFNYVIATKGNGKSHALLAENPVKILSQLESWYELEERDTTIHADDLKDWYQAVMGLESNKLRDFFLFLIFSGLRRNEAMCLEWIHFDTKAKTLTIPKELSKTKKTRKIPLTDVLLDIHRSRRTNIVVGNRYVFQGMHGKGHLTEPKRGVNLVKEAVSKRRKEIDLKDESTINWSSHDLRRTYVTLANRLDVSAYKVKFLVGHSVSGDVTGKHYSKLTVDDVRDAAQEIANFLKDKMGMEATALEAINE